MPYYEPLSCLTCTDQYIAYGFGCDVVIDPEAAEYYSSEACLLPLSYEPECLVDRFDGRLLLDSLTDGTSGYAPFHRQLGFLVNALHLHL